MTDARFHAGTLLVTVPATSANLGPGYDSFGLALDLHDEIAVRVAEADLKVVVEGEGQAKVRKDEKNLVVKTMLETFTQLGARPSGLVVECTNRIPHGRGLGSSAAAIVAGIAAARGLTVDGELKLDNQRMLELATASEGHPDNVAATILGGFTISWTGTDGVGAVSLPVHPDIAPVAFIPDSELRTATARGVIPQTIPHVDAAANTARAALLVHAISHDPGLLMTATSDWLHQQYRESVMPSSLQLMNQLRAAQVAAVVSGAGPTVLALVDRTRAAQLLSDSFPGWTVRQLASQLQGVQTRLG